MAHPPCSSCQTSPELATAIARDLNLLDRTCGDDGFQGIVYCVIDGCCCYYPFCRVCALNHLVSVRWHSPWQSQVNAQDQSYAAWGHSPWQTLHFNAQDQGKGEGKGKGRSNAEAKAKAKAKAWPHRTDWHATANPQYPDPRELLPYDSWLIVDGASADQAASTEQRRPSSFDQAASTEQHWSSIDRAALHQ